MKKLNKSWLYGLILLVVLVFFEVRYGNVFLSAGKGEAIKIEGGTMGTSYHITYFDEEGRNFQSEIDSIFKDFNQSLSTYIPDSEISTFNKTAIFKFELPYFLPMLEKSKEIYELSHGAYDPTVGALVNAWGFGPEGRQTPDALVVDSLLSIVGFDSIYYDSIAVCKLKANIQLDFSAIAKGYGADVISQFLLSKGIEDHFVEIGGEIMCHGRNQQNKEWRVGINVPSPDAEMQSAAAIISLTDRGIATSGNYRNYYIKDGRKYAHTISPVTGAPVEHSLLSATVVAPDCATADAVATALMVMGLEAGKKMLESREDLEAYLIYSDEQGKMRMFVTEGLSDQVKSL